MMRPLSLGTDALSMISRPSQHESIQLPSILGPGPKHHSDPSARDQDGIIIRARLISLEVSSSGSCGLTFIKQKQKLSFNHYIHEMWVSTPVKLCLIWCDCDLKSFPVGNSYNTFWILFWALPKNGWFPSPWPCLGTLPLLCSQSTLHWLMPGALYRWVPGPRPSPDTQASPNSGQFRLQRRR